MIARCIALGLPIADVPIRTIYGGEPSHIRPWRHFTEFLRVSRDARRIVARAAERRPREGAASPGPRRSRRNGTSATRMSGRPSSARSIRRPFSL